MKRLVLLLTLALSTPAHARAEGDGPLADAGVAAIRAQWEAQSGYLLRAAEQMPEADYAFRPVATVRSFGQLIGHVAGIAERHLRRWRSATRSATRTRSRSR